MHLELAISLFSKYVVNDNDKIRNRIKNLLYIYNKCIKNIKLKYFFIFYYKALKMKLSEHDNKSKKSDKNRIYIKNEFNEKNIFNKTFNFPLRTIFHNTANSNNDNIHYKSKRLKIINNSKNDYFNNIEHKIKTSGNYHNFSRKKKGFLNNNSFNISLKNRTFQNNFEINLHNKIKNIIYNYINDMRNYNRKKINERKFIPLIKSHMISGNKTTTNKGIFENAKNKNKAKFFDNNFDGFKYNYRKNIKNEEEKNKDKKNIQTIHINNYYILNSSFINENLKKSVLNDLYKKEFNSSFNKNHLANSPNKTLKNGFKFLKSKMTEISQKIKREIFNQINKKQDIQYKYNNIYFKYFKKRFPLSSNHTMENLNLKNKNKRKKLMPILEDRMKNIIQINKNSVLYNLNKKNNFVQKYDNDNRLINTRNFLDNYNNSLLTTFNKERNNNKDTNDSGFFSTAKDTSKKNSLIYKINLTNYKSKPGSNKKKINEDNIEEKNIGNFSISSNKKNNSSNKREQTIIVRNNSYIGKIKNRKEKLNSNDIIIQNLSFSKCSEYNNKFVNKNQNLNQNYKKIYDKKIINVDNNENKNEIKIKEKVIETSSETLNDSKIYEMAKNLIKNSEESIDKHIMEEILRNKRYKKEIVKFI